MELFVGEGEGGIGWEQSSLIISAQAQPAGNRLLQAIAKNQIFYYLFSIS